MKKSLILCVEDNDDLRELIVEMLSYQGFEVTSASSGDDAFTILEKHPDIDLILLDIIMPGLTGLEVLKILKNNPDTSEIPVIMVTGFSQISGKEEAFNLGANDYLVKPFENQELQLRVQTQIRLRTALQQEKILNEQLKNATEQITVQKNIQDMILSTVPGIVYLKDSKRRYILGNDFFAAVIGIPVEKIRGMSDEEIFPADIVTDRIKTDNLILDLGIRELEFEEDIPGTDGAVRHYFTKKRLVTDKEGRVCGLVGVSIDITEWVILKETRCENEALLLEIMNKLPCELWVTGIDQTIILQNQSHVNRWGNVFGTKISDLPVQADIIDKWKSQNAEALEGNNILDDYIQDEVDGKHRYVKLLSRISTESGVIGVMGLRFDISPLIFSRDNVNNKSAMENQD